MNDLIKDMFYSRRGFLTLMAATGASMGLSAPTVAALANAAARTGGVPGAGGVAGGDAGDDGDLRPLAELMPEGYEAYAANPNFKALWAPDRTPPCRDGNKLRWIEIDQSDQTVCVCTFDPETSLERADAAELYELSYHKSWRTFGELRALVASGGRDARWVVRQSCMGRPQGAVTSALAPRLLTMERIDAQWWDALPEGEGMTRDPAAMAHLTTEQVLRLVPRLQATVADAGEYGDGDPRLYEPVRPEHAGKDLRVFRLRKSGWAPQVGETYDLAALAEIFTPGAPIVLPEPDRHPFVRVPDAWLALVDYGRGPGVATIEGALRFVWQCGCRSGDDDADGDPPPCECMPPALRQNDQTALVHLFVRAGAAGRYTYVGLGHVPPGARDGGVALDVVPEIGGAFYRSLGGSLAWTASGDDSAGAWRHYGELASQADVDRVLAAAAELRAGSIYFSRWGPDQIELRYFGDRCAIRMTLGSDERRAYLFLTNPAFVGEGGGAPATLSDELGPMEVPVNGILPRAAAASLIAELPKAEPDPPGGPWWSSIDRSSSVEAG